MSARAASSLSHAGSHSSLAKAQSCSRQRRHPAEELWRQFSTRDQHCGDDVRTKSRWINVASTRRAAGRTQQQSRHVSRFGAGAPLRGGREDRARRLSVGVLATGHTMEVLTRRLQADPVLARLVSSDRQEPVPVFRSESGPKSSTFPLCDTDHGSRTSARHQSPRRCSPSPPARASRFAAQVGDASAAARSGNTGHALDVGTWRPSRRVMWQWTDGGRVTYVRRHVVHSDCPSRDRRQLTDEMRALRQIKVVDIAHGSSRT